MNEPAPLHVEIAGAPGGGRAFWLTASDGMRLRAALWPGGGRGTVAILPGRTEYIEKYGRIIGKLVDRGLSVAILDWRGQGLSDRHPANPNLGHVEDFRHYQRDVAALLELITQEDLPAPLYMLAHSMGGCIGLRTLLEQAQFSGAILSAPMWHLQMRAATRELTSKMTRLANLVGLGGRLTPGTNARPTPLAVQFEGNALTGHRETFDWMVRQINAVPDLSLGGPSMQWTYAALEEMARLYVAPVPGIPVTVFLGTRESVVSHSVIRSQVAKMAGGELVICDGAHHEVLMEGPEVQKTVWAAIDAFLERVPALRTPHSLTASR